MYVTEYYIDSDQCIIVSLSIFISTVKYYLLSLIFIIR